MKTLKMSPVTKANQSPAALTDGIGQIRLGETERDIYFAFNHRPYKLSLSPENRTSLFNGY